KFSQKSDQKLASNPGMHFSLDYEEVYRQPHPEGSFYSIFCEKIVLVHQTFLLIEKKISHCGRCSVG
ncbi:MAG: hypothetical protein U9N43_03245, partial [Euryarchaeota archaeon]|nr:hypothetical protein [Euryarchaeota archaeon]